MPRKPSPTSSKNYFTQETEKYIILYNQTEDIEEKNRIFTEHIYYPFYKLAENIIHTFKFYHIDTESIEDLKLDVVRMLLEEKIFKFDPTKGAKAFSYFGTIVKHWLQAYCISNFEKQKKGIPVEECLDLPVENPNVEDIDLSEFIDKWIVDIDSRVDQLFSRDQDRKVVDAIILLFKTRQDISILRKKALYVYIREITGCDTPGITKVIKVLKADFYKNYLQYQDQ